MSISRWLACSALLPVLGCSSVPMLPGGANLATTGYVDETSAENVKSELPGALDSALVDDRKQIAQLQQRVLSQETEIEASKRQLEALSNTIDQLRADVNSQSETFRELTRRLQATADGLDRALVALPKDTLRLFSDALLKHLAALESAEASPAPAPGAPSKVPSAPDPQGAVRADGG
jgi:septal ring factor EnvC (AmiA/AmiB activator)